MKLTFVPAVAIVISLLSLDAFAHAAFNKQQNPPNGIYQISIPSKNNSNESIGIASEDSFTTMQDYDKDGTYDNVLIISAKQRVEFAIPQSGNYQYLKITDRLANTLLTREFVYSNGNYKLIRQNERAYQILSREPSCNPIRSETINSSTMSYLVDALKASDTTKSTFETLLDESCKTEETQEFSKNIIESIEQFYGEDFSKESDGILACLDKNKLGNFANELRSWTTRKWHLLPEKDQLKLSCSVNANVNLHGTYDEKRRTITFNKKAIDSMNTQEQLRSLKTTFFHEALHEVFKDEGHVHAIEGCCAENDVKDCEKMSKINEELIRLQSFVVAFSQTANPNGAFENLIQELSYTTHKRNRKSTLMGETADRFILSLLSFNKGKSEEKGSNNEPCDLNKQDCLDKIKKNADDYTERFFKGSGEGTCQDFLKQLTNDKYVVLNCERFHQSVKTYFSELNQNTSCHIETNYQEIITAKGVGCLALAHAQLKALQKEDMQFSDFDGIRTATADIIDNESKETTAYRNAFKEMIPEFSEFLDKLAHDEDESSANISNLSLAELSSMYLNRISWTAKKGYRNDISYDSCLRNNHGDKILCTENVKQSIDKYQGRVLKRYCSKAFAGLPNSASTCLKHVEEALKIFQTKASQTCSGSKVEYFEDSCLYATYKYADKLAQHENLAKEYLSHKRLTIEPDALDKVSTKDFKIEKPDQEPTVITEIDLNQSDLGTKELNKKINKIAPENSSEIGRLADIAKNAAKTAYNAAIPSAHAVEDRIEIPDRKPCQVPACNSAALVVVSGETASNDREDRPAAKAPKVVSKESIDVEPVAPKLPPSDSEKTPSAIASDEKPIGNYEIADSASSRSSGELFNTLKNDHSGKLDNRQPETKELTNVNKRKNSVGGTATKSNRSLASLSTKPNPSNNEVNYDSEKADKYFHNNKSNDRSPSYTSPSNTRMPGQEHKQKARKNLASKDYSENRSIHAREQNYQRAFAQRNPERNDGMFYSNKNNDLIESMLNKIKGENLVPTSDQVRMQLEELEAEIEQLRPHQLRAMLKEPSFKRRIESLPIKITDNSEIKFIRPDALMFIQIRKDISIAWRQL